MARPSPQSQSGLSGRLAATVSGQHLRIVLELTDYDSFDALHREDSVCRAAIPSPRVYVRV
jgi:hypothetical protein